MVSSSAQETSEIGVPLHNQALRQSHAKEAYGYMSGHMLVLIHIFSQMKHESFSRPYVASGEHQRLHVLAFFSVIGSTDLMVSFPKVRLQMLDGTSTRPQSLGNVVKQRLQRRGARRVILRPCSTKTDRSESFLVSHAV